MQRIVIYLGHPAQYHFVKHVIRRLIAEGVRVKVLIKTKDILEQLLIEDKVEYTNIQPNVRGSSATAILWASFKRMIAVYRIAKRFKAQMIIGTDSSVAQSAWLLRIPALTILEDDVDVIEKLARLTYPFTTDIVVPSVCRVGRWEEKKIPYYGYMKLAYLHPNYFHPNKAIVENYGLPEKYCLVRMAKLTAYHDHVLVNRCMETNTLIRGLLDIAKSNDFSVYITSESILAPEFAPYQLRIRSTDIHHVLGYASLLVSDSQSMSVEAAMLGVPSLRFSDFSGRISVLEELENEYHLTWGIKTDNPERLLQMAEELLTHNDLHKEYQERRARMLAEKIDVTRFLTWYIEEYPSSREIIKRSPRYQLRFR